MNRSRRHRGILTWIVALCAMLLVTLAPVSHAVAAPGHGQHAVAVVSSHSHAGLSSSGMVGHHGMTHDHAHETPFLPPVVQASEKTARLAWMITGEDLISNLLNWILEQPPKLST